MSTTISSSVTGPVVLVPATDNPLYITGTGTVTSTGTADGIDGGAGTTWTISNAGVVSAAVTGNGVSLAGSGTVGNTGSISGNDALLLSAGGSVTNNVGGSISGLGALGVGIATGAGVYIGGAAGTMTNHGAISGVAYGVVLGAGGLVTNTSSITGGEDGVTVHGGAATIANYGSITATVDDGIGLFAGGSVTNATGATISATGTKGASIYITGGIAAITNAGSISGSSPHGMLIEDGGNVLNEASGSISGVNTGVFFKVQPGTVTNAGQITATGTQGSGVYMENGGSLTNTSTGTITGHKFGVFLEGAATTVANYGSISGTTYDGVVLGLGGTVTNAAGASISGLTGGIYIKYRAAGTVTNSGNISATGTGSAAIDLADGGVVTNNSTGSISGTAFGVFITGAAGTVTNAGRITSAKYGAVELVKGGTVTNNAGASITGGSIGVYGEAGASATVTNSGMISAASAGGAGVDLAGGGSVTNNAGGSISGAGFGIFTTGALATISNSGSISGSHGIALEAGGSITNTSSGAISGQVAGVFSQGAAATLSNAGSISATAGAAADMEAGGSVTNLAGATLSGSTFGIFLIGGSGAVTNAGAITGGTDGIELGAGGSVTNNAGGSISGTSFGVFATGVIATVNNSGSISGSKAVGLEAGGNLTNAASGSISGQLDGVHAQVGAASVSNAGHISATAGSGVDLEAGGSVTNLAGATISGTSFGVYINGGSGTVTNAGTISGGTYAVDFAGSGTNRLVVDPGAVFVGKVNGGTGTSTLELAAGTGSISGIGTGSFNNFKVLAVDVGATWTLNGANVAPTALDNGTLVVAGSFDVSTAIDPSSTGLFQLGSSATLEVAAATGSTAQIKFQGSSSELIIDNAALFGINVGSASYAGPQLQSFVGGDKIDLKNFSAAGVTFSYNASTGILQISNSAHQVAGLEFQTSSLGSAHFAVSGDGANGVIITVDPPPPVVTTSNLTENPLQTLAASSLFTVSDQSGYAITEYQFRNSTSDPASGHFYFNGVEVADHTVLDVTAAQLSEVTFVTGIDQTSLQVRAFDGVNWSAPDTAQWAPFTVTPPPTVIEAHGVTSLLQSGSNYFLNPVSSGTTITGPELNVNGVAVVAGQLSGWTVIGAEQVTGGGYDVALELAGTNDFAVWSTNSGGTYLTNLIGVVSGTSSTLENFETVFQQDLNGDGTIGPPPPPPPTVIEAHGVTSLLQSGSNYFLNPVSSGTTITGPELNVNGVAVVAGQLSGWTVIGAEQVTGGGYDVALELAGTNDFAVWSTNSGGTYLTNLIGVVSGTSSTLENFETVFQQDLNGDGTIGPPPPPPPTVIEAHGVTSLLQSGSNYFLNPVSSGTTITGPELNVNGVAVVAGQLSGWTVIGAEQVTGGGYDVALELAGTNDFAVWSTNSGGTYLTNLIGVVSGTSSTLENFETVFQQDLNGDGTIGPPPPPPPTVIEAHGVTSLLQSGSNYFLNPVSSGTTITGPELNVNGVAVVAGQLSGWTVIGAEQVTGGGYDVALELAGTNDFAVWSTNSGGTYLTNLIGVVSGTSSTLENFETVFQQDLNGDGTIGPPPPPPPTVIEAHGVTSLLQSGSNYFLNPVSSGTTITGPELNVNGVAVVAGQLSGWTVIGAEQVTGGGYDVALELAGTNDFAVWSTNSGGTYLTNLIGVVSGTSSTLENFETIFGQDLNGDGHTGIYVAPGTTLQVTSPLPAAVGAATIGTGATLELGTADSASITFNSSTGMLKLDSLTAFSGVIDNFTGNGSLAGSDQIDLKGINFNSVHDSYSNGVLTVTDGTSTTALDFNGTYVLANFKFASDGGGGTIVYDPPVPAQPQSPSAIGHTEGNNAAGFFGSAGHDSFVFAPNPDPANFAPAANNVPFDHRSFTNSHAALTEAHEDPFGSSPIHDAAHVAQWLTHHSDFHFI